MYRQVLTKPIQKIFSNKFKYYNEHFEEIKMLGKGAFGEVWLVRHKHDKQSYAIKKLILSEDQHSISKTLQEIKTLLKLQSIYVVQYYNAWTEANEVQMNKECTDYFLTAQNITFNDFKQKTHSYEYVEVYEEDEEQNESSVSREEE